MNWLDAIIILLIAIYAVYIFRSIKLMRHLLLQGLRLKNPRLGRFNSIQVAIQDPYNAAHRSGLEKFRKLRLICSISIVLAFILFMINVLY